MEAKTIDLASGDTKVDDLLTLLRDGREVILTDGDTPLARLVPFSSSVRSRIPGLHAHMGAAWMSDDFDEPLPDEFWTGTDETATR